MPIPSPNPLFDNLLESSLRDDSNKQSHLGFGEEITQAVSIDVNFTHLIWSSDYISKCYIVYNVMYMYILVTHSHSTVFAY